MTEAVQIDNWDQLKLFLAVARQGKLEDAAEHLGVHHSTVYRRLNAFEDELDARLFDRVPSGYALTEAGRELQRIAEVVEDQVLEIERKIRGSSTQLAGQIRVTCTGSMLGALMPAFQEFRRQYPGITLRLLIDERIYSLARMEADVAIRPGTPPEEPEVRIRRLTSLDGAVFGSKGYVERHGRPEEVDDLDDHRVILADESISSIGSERWIREHAGGADVVMRCNDLTGHIAAVRAGLGLAAMPCLLVEGDDDLIQLTPTVPEMGGSLWLLLRGDLRETARVRALLDFLAGWFQGRDES
jgi:DNA-binding transcriptional LysR family regulator